MSRLIALFRILGKRFHDQCIHARLNLGIQRGGCRRHLIRNLSGQFDWIGGVKRFAVGHHLVQHRAPGKQIRAQIDCISAHLFRRRVGQQPSQAVAGLGGDQAHGGDAVAENLDQPIPLHHDFRRFQRSVRHALGPGCVQTRAHLARDIQKIPDRKAFLAREHRRNAVSLDVLHRGTELALDFTGAVKRCDVLGRQFTRTFTFSDQRLHKSGRTFAERLQILSLKRYRLIGFRIRRLIDQSGVGLGEFTLDFKSTKYHCHCSRLAVTAALLLSIDSANNRGRGMFRITPETRRRELRKYLRFRLSQSDLGSYCERSQSSTICRTFAPSGRRRTASRTETRTCPSLPRKPTQ